MDVSGASSAGLLLADQNDTLHYMAASSEGARHLELFQLQHSEGPCLDCFRTREPVITSDLSQEASGGPTSRRARSRPASARCMPSRCGCATG